VGLKKFFLFKSNDANYRGPRIYYLLRERHHTLIRAYPEKRLIPCSVETTSGWRKNLVKLWNWFSAYGVGIDGNLYYASGRDKQVRKLYEQRRYR
jgi:hypothetical protein